MNSFDNYLIKRLFAIFLQLMVVIATGINGVSAQFLVLEDRRLATGHVITRNHSMAEKIAQLLDSQLKQRNAVPVNVPVSKCKKRE